MPYRHLKSLPAQVVLEKMDFPEPVIKVSCEPTSQKADKLGEALNKLAAEGRRTKRWNLYHQLKALFRLCRKNGQPHATTQNLACWPMLTHVDPCYIPRPLYQEFQPPLAAPCVRPCPTGPLKASEFHGCQPFLITKTDGYHMISS